MKRTIHPPAPFMAGDYIGAREWEIMRLLAEEESEAAQITLVERIQRQPSRFEVLA